jgi:hypothetical protein
MLHREVPGSQPLGAIGCLPTTARAFASSGTSITFVDRMNISTAPPSGVVAVANGNGKH